jgi:hypothetical protein
MKSFKRFVEDKKYHPKEVSALQGLVATMPDATMTNDKIDIDLIDNAIKKPISENTNQLVSIGQKMMMLAPKEKDDKIANAYAKLGDALTRYGTSFSAKSITDLEKTTGLKKELITMLIKRVQKQ